MVQHAETPLNGSENLIPDKPAKGIPSGNYRLVGWAIDTTGRRLIDEICQIGAYTPSSNFSQYIMPYADINPSYSHKHALRVVNTGRYRMLRDLKNDRFVKTKSEISALVDFIRWLEENRGEAEDGVILIYNELRKSAPAMLLEALRRYDLLERFSAIVKGFANGFQIAAAKCANTTKSLSLRVLSKMLLNKETNDLTSATDRAQVTYDIVVHLSQSEREDLDVKASGDNTGLEPQFVDFICPFTNPIAVEEEEIAELKELLKVQNTFRPVFRSLLSGNRVERKHANHLRRLLAENSIDFEKLKEAYTSGGKEGLDKVLKTELINVIEDDLKELLEILDCFFDPEKAPVQSKNRYPSNQRKRSRQRKNSSKEKSNPSSPTSSSGNQTEVASETGSPRIEKQEEAVVD